MADKKPKASSVITLGGKGSSLSAASVFAVANGLAQVRIDSSALSTIADVVEAMSSEASKADVGALNLMDSGDGLSVKDEVGVASDLKVLLNGSKLVGKVEVDAVSEIPKIHGSLREVVRMVLLRTRVELNSGGKSGEIRWG